MPEATKSIWEQNATPRHRIQWCPGCGDFAVLNALKAALTTLELTPSEVLLVGGAREAGAPVHRGAPPLPRPGEAGLGVRGDLHRPVVLGRSQARDPDVRRGGAPQGVCHGERFLAVRDL